MKRTSLIVVAVMAVPAMALAAATKLTPSQIKATFGTGKPFTATTSPGNVSYTFTFNSDGTAARTPTKSTTTTKGRWHTDVDGYCTMWGSVPEQCYTVEKNGDQYNVKDSSGKVIAHWMP